MKVDPTCRTEYRKNSLERRHNEVYAWFRNFTIQNLEDWFYCCGDAWLWLMLVQLLHLIPTRFFTFSQHAQEWIFGVQVKWRQHYVALLVLVLNPKEDPSASCSRCTPGAGGGIGCALSGKKWNQPPLKREQRLTLKKVSFQYLTF